MTRKAHLLLYYTLFRCGQLTADGRQFLFQVIDKHNDRGNYIEDNRKQCKSQADADAVCVAAIPS